VRKCIVCSGSGYTGGGTKNKGVPKQLRVIGLRRCSNCDGKGEVPVLVISDDDVEEILKILDLNAIPLAKDSR